MDGISEETRLEILAQCTGNVFDIVDSLRAVAERDQAYANVSLYGQAANEIDRLRKEVARYIWLREQPAYPVWKLVAMCQPDKRDAVIDDMIKTHNA